MSDQTLQNNKRIAKNAIALYVRTIIVLLISLYTSRLVLNALGVSDYGIYNIIGGVVAMFSVVSGSISTSISRFITFELGHNDKNRLSLIFSSSLVLLFLLGIIIFVLGETVGLWFVNNQMNIPEERMNAANYIFQFSLITFIIGLICIPYNACIMAHERMTAFAYISVLDAVLKLSICLSLNVVKYDKLIFYGLMLLISQIVIRIVYSMYCSSQFEECRNIRLICDNSMLKQLGGFAGWTSLMHSTYIVNTQGINILMNMFFGVVVNAARGIASSVEGSIMMFVNNFLTAVYPQITKLYAAGQLTEMYKLICRGAKYAYFLLLLFALPIYLETEIILRLWLGTIPEHTVTFFRLSILATTINSIGNTGNCGCQSTGKVKSFSIIMSIIPTLMLPLTYLAYKVGMSVESSYIVYIIIQCVLIWVRLSLLKRLIRFPPIMYLKTVLIPIMLVTICSILAPIAIMECMGTSVLRLIIIVLVSLCSISLSILFVGCQKHERYIIIEFIKNKVNRVSI